MLVSSAGLGIRNVQWGHVIVIILGMVQWFVIFVMGAETMLCGVCVCVCMCVCMCVHTCNYTRFVYRKCMCIHVCTFVYVLCMCVCVCVWCVKSRPRTIQLTSFKVWC